MFCVIFRVVRETLQQFKSSEDWKVTAQALAALQESAEMYIVQFLEDSYLCTLHRQRITLAPKDMALVKILRGVNDPGRN